MGTSKTALTSRILIVTRRLDRRDRLQDVVFDIYRLDAYGSWLRVVRRLQQAGVGASVGERWRVGGAEGG